MLTNIVKTLTKASTMFYKPTSKSPVILDILLQTRLSYNIHIESFNTPNPNFLKFVPERTDIMGEKGTMDISSEKFADASPLAQ